MSRYRIVITPIVTESGFRDTKTYEVQRSFKKGWFFNRRTEWETIQAFENIAEANKLLREKLPQAAVITKNNSSGYSGYSGFSGKRSS